MKTLQTYLFVTFFLLGLFLISGCGQTESPITTEETSTYGGEQTLLKSNDEIVTYVFSFNSTGFEFDFGNSNTIQTGTFSYDSSNPVIFNNGQGFYIFDFNFVPSVSFDSQRDIGWVPQPSFDETTIETWSGQLDVINDQWELFDSDGNMVFQISAHPDGSGGFTGTIGETRPGGVLTAATFTLVIDNKITICHKPGTPAEKTLLIPIEALDGHLGHGDLIGPCQ
jgi:hypothetical protein